MSALCVFKCLTNTIHLDIITAITELGKHACFLL